MVSCFVNPDSGTAALVMPFVNHKPFSEYFNKLDLREIRLYIRGLLLSLRHLHALGILHRDIKPPNFLFDPISGQATLVDFGLSEEIKNRQHFPETPLKKNLNCTCTYQQVCKLCLTKQSIRASRAGTGGFRPPEVLLKYQQQDQKIDIWAAGVCLIILLSRRYPYFPAVEDSLALVHIASLLGKSSIMEVAVSLGKRLSFAGIPDPVHSLAETVHLQRKNSSRGVSSPSETASSEWRHVIDLLRSLLNPDPKKRPDASEALQMDFFLLYS